MKTILHLCADTGSDSWPYRQDPDYEVITIGKSIGVENYRPDRPIHGVFANPVCTEFSIARDGKPRDAAGEGMRLVRECLRIISACRKGLSFWVIENPATGTLKEFLGKPTYSYEPWWYGSPWTKKTALWGNFNIPTRTFSNWEDVPKLSLYTRPGRPKPSLAFLHKSAWASIPEFNQSGMPTPTSDMEFRSICSQKFAQAFKEANP
jgi:hypothetical protein